MRHSVGLLIVLPTMVLVACAGPPREGEASRANMQCADEKPFGSHIVQPKCHAIEGQGSARQSVSEYEDAKRRNPTRDQNVSDGSIPGT